MLATNGGAVTSTPVSRLCNVPSASEETLPADDVLSDPFVALLAANVAGPPTSAQRAVILFGRFYALDVIAVSYPPPHIFRPSLRSNLKPAIAPLQLPRGLIGLYQTLVPEPDAYV